MKSFFYSLVSLSIFIPQLHCISLADYIKQHGMPQIQYDHLSGLLLDLSGKNLTDLSGLRDIPDIERLNHLDLENNQLQALPNNIFSGLNKLQELYLNDNQLKTLPINIFSGLNNLQILSIEDNPFNIGFMFKLPDVMQNIPNLQYLDGKQKDKALQSYINEAVDIFVGTVSKGDIGAVKNLLNQGVDVNAQDTDGNTPLMHAVQNEHIELVKIFLEHGADIKQQNYRDETALTIAKNLGNTEITKLLIQAAQESQKKYVEGFQQQLRRI